MIDSRESVVAKGKPPTDKWVNGLTASDSVSTAASHSLRDRLSAVEHFVLRAGLPGNAHDGVVHELRVATRRTLATLKLYRDVFPTGPRESLQRTLRKLLRAAGRKRDLDVLAHRYRKLKTKVARQLVKGLRKQRVSRQRQLAELCSNLQTENQLSRRSDLLLKNLDVTNSVHGRFQAWAHARWPHFVEVFSRSSEVDASDLESLHQFRICGKELRYAMESLAPTFHQELLNSTYASVAELQERLGHINDHRVALKLFSQWNAKGNTLSTVCNLKKLRNGERRWLEQAITEFNAWWTPSRISNLLLSLAQLSESKVDFG